MNSFDPLKMTLLDLAYELRDTGFPLILAGGYGLYLKQLHRQRPGAPRTLLPSELWPAPRNTEDLDLFLQTDIVASVEHMKAVRSALDRLGFSLVERVKFMHFEKSLGAIGQVKVDLLTGPIDDPATRRKLRLQSKPRVRPKGKVELHAYLTNEAIGVEEAPTEIPVAGSRSMGDPCQTIVHVPQPFTFLLMKLHAFADRKEDADRDLGRHHALDLYRLVALLTEEEYKSAREQIGKHRAQPAVSRAEKVVDSDFRDLQATGILRLREHALVRPNFDFATFLAVLRELFVKETHGT